MTDKEVASKLYFTVTFCLQTLGLLACEVMLLQYFFLMNCLVSFMLNCMFYILAFINLFHAYTGYILFKTVSIKIQIFIVLCWQMSVHEVEEKNSIKC